MWEREVGPTRRDGTCLSSETVLVALDDGGEGQQRDVLATPLLFVLRTSCARARARASGSAWGSAWGSTRFRAAVR